MMRRPKGYGCMVSLFVAGNLAGVGAPIDPQDSIKEKFLKAEAQNAAQLHQYGWTSRTQLKIKGEGKGIKLESVRYDASGQFRKAELDGFCKGPAPLAEVFTALTELAQSYAHLTPSQKPGLRTRRNPIEGSRSEGGNNRTSRNQRGLAGRRRGHVDRSLLFPGKGSPHQHPLRKQPRGAGGHLREVGGGVQLPGRNESSVPARGVTVGGAELELPASFNAWGRLVGQGLCGGVPQRHCAESVGRRDNMAFAEKSGIRIPFARIDAYGKRAQGGRSTTTAVGIW